MFLTRAYACGEYGGGHHGCESHWCLGQVGRSESQGGRGLKRPVASVDRRVCPAASKSESRVEMAYESLGGGSAEV